MKKRLFAVILAMSCLMTACAPKEEAPKATQPQTTAAEISQKETTAEGSAAQPAQTAGEKVLTIGTPYTLDTFLPWQFTSDGDRYVIAIFMSASLNTMPTPVFRGLRRAIQIRTTALGMLKSETMHTGRREMICLVMRRCR